MRKLYLLFNLKMSQLQVLYLNQGQSKCRKPIYNMEGRKSRDAMTMTD